MGIAADESVLVIARSKICMHCCGVTKSQFWYSSFLRGPCMHTGAGGLSTGGFDFWPLCRFARSITV